MVEFPHSVTFLTEQKVSDGGGGFTMSWVDYVTIDAFMDTPTSREMFQAQQLQTPLDRNLYYAYRTDILPSMRVRHGTDTYELQGKPMDQGGQNEIMMVPLALVNNG